MERLGHQKARTYKLEDYYRDFFTVLFIRGCLRYNNNNAWGEQGYADFPNKRARHLIIFPIFFPPPHFLTNKKSNEKSPNSTFFTYINEKISNSYVYFDLHAYLRGQSKLSFL